MKTPLKDKLQGTKSISVLKKIVPAGYAVAVYPFFGGNVALKLAESGRPVAAIAHSKPVYEFWKCLSEDPKRIVDIITSDIFKFEAAMFPILQEKWYTYKGEYTRAALFFILNRCSDTGLISSGCLSLDNYSPVSISSVRSYKPSKYFNLRYVNHTQASIIENLHSDYVFMPIGKYTLNLFEEGKSFGCEETRVDHKRLRKEIRETDKKVIISYLYHPRLKSFYDNESVIMINKYGKVTTVEEDSVEMLICNFESQASLSNTTV
tara:strand:+ start:3324 stop:4115 length:792 start_codon:yes stop_codon:yes gene_type:complete